MIQPLQIINIYRNLLGSDVWSIIINYINDYPKFLKLMPNIKHHISLFMRNDIKRIEMERYFIYNMYQTAKKCEIEMIKIKYFIILKGSNIIKPNIIYNLYFNKDYTQKNLKLFENIVSKYINIFYKNFYYDEKYLLLQLKYESSSSCFIFKNSKDIISKNYDVEKLKKLYPSDY